MGYYEDPHNHATPTTTTPYHQTKTVMHSQDYRRSSTPKSSRRLNHEQEHLVELQRNVSELALENEELKCELHQVKEELQKALMEIQNRDTIMRKQIHMVTEIAYALYEKIRTLKHRQYEKLRTAPKELS